jgi:hypothetical protein
MRRALDALGDRFDAQLELILKIASGDVAPEPDERNHLLKMIDGALAALRVPLVGTMGDVLPSGFWLTELGLAIMRARVILADDELITCAEAARRLYGAADKSALMRVKRLADAGRLTSYRDPGAEPSESGLLSAREVQALIEQGQK